MRRWHWHVGKVVEAVKGRSPVCPDAFIGLVSNGLGRRTEHRQQQHPAHGESKEEKDKGHLAGRSGKGDSEPLDAVNVREHIVEPVRYVVLGNVDVASAWVSSIDLEKEAPEDLVKLHSFRRRQRHCCLIHARHGASGIGEVADCPRASIPLRYDAR